MHYIIDGYNLLQRCYAESLKKGLESARVDLEGRLRRWLAKAKDAERLTLVYDGAKGGTGNRVGGQFEVVFARPPKSADDVILDRCRQLRGGENAVVVTSDRTDIGVRLKGLPCRWMTSEDFARRLALLSAKEGDSSEKPDGVKGSEVDDWLHTFGLHPDDEEEAF